MGNIFLMVLTIQNTKKVNIYFRETPWSLWQSIDWIQEWFTLSENTEHQVIGLFRELLSKPHVIAGIKERIHSIGNPFIEKTLQNALAEVGDLHADIVKVQNKTHARLGYLMASLDPKLTQWYNPNTTA